MQNHVGVVVEVPQPPLADWTMAMPKSTMDERIVKVPNGLSIRCFVSGLIPRPVSCSLTLLDNHVRIPVHKHRHVPMVSTVQRHVEAQQVQFVDWAVPAPEMKHMQMPMIQ